jgi:hypothetical protein
VTEVTVAREFCATGATPHYSASGRERTVAETVVDGGYRPNLDNNSVLHSEQSFQ